MEYNFVLSPLEEKDGKLHFTVTVNRPGKDPIVNQYSWGDPKKAKEEYAKAKEFCLRRSTRTGYEDKQAVVEATKPITPAKPAEKKEEAPQEKEPQKKEPKKKKETKVAKESEEKDSEG